MYKCWTEKNLITKKISFRMKPSILHSDKKEDALKASQKLERPSLFLTPIMWTAFTYVVHPCHRNTGIQPLTESSATMSQNKCLLCWVADIRFLVLERTILTDIINVFIFLEIMMLYLFQRTINSWTELMI